MNRIRLIQLQRGAERRIAVEKGMGSRVETAIVQFSSSRQTLTLSGKVAYGEDRYSRISSPLQGRVVEVRAHLGDRVKTGDILLVVDSPDIAQAYSEYVKEDSELEYATRAYELAKDLYEDKALPLKDLKQAENELIKARATFRRAKERLLSLRIALKELEKPLEKQQITSRFEMKSPLTGIVVERTVTPGQSVTSALTARSTPASPSARWSSRTARSISRPGPGSWPTRIRPPNGRKRSTRAWR